MFFLLLLIPGIPALVKKHYIVAGITLGVFLLLIVVCFWKWISRQYAQFLAAIIISSFNFCLFLFPDNQIENLPRGIMFFRGYAFASINVALLSRFPSLLQKLIFLMFAYAFRFALVTQLDPQSVDVYTIIRHAYIDLFIIYSAYLDEKKMRSVFRNFYEVREGLTKFKELLVDYLPQSITILSDVWPQATLLKQGFPKAFQPKRYPEQIPGSNQRASSTNVSDRPLIESFPKLDLSNLLGRQRTL